MNRELPQESILWQLYGRDNWDVCDFVLTAEYVINKMPLKMRTIVELRCRGHTIITISNRMKISTCTVRTHLRRAKRRICAAIL
jgi:DNA-binding NarL/FixJ family response regulator